MKTKTILVALCLATGFTLTTNTADAAGYMVNDTTAVFFTTFIMDASYGSFGLPVAADNTVGYFDRVDVLGYELKADDDQLPEISTVADLVLSNAPIVDNRYQIATGTVSSFTLMSIVTFAEPVTSELTANITKIPYWVDGRRTTVHENQLSDIPPTIISQ